MKTALVIVSRNAGCAARWKEILSAWDRQTLPPDLRLLADSGSSDGTAEAARDAGWTVRSVEPDSFRHGGTRSEIAEELADAGFEFIFFATQDALPGAPDVLETLMRDLESGNGAAAYARQVPSPDAGAMDSFFRKKNYPAEPRLQTKADILNLGWKTAFCSNTLALWRVDKLREYGFFPETDFGEDMLLAAKMILGGETIVYSARTICIHGHADTLRTLFLRGFAIGCMRRKNHALLKKFGGPGTFFRGTEIFELLKFAPGLAVKTAGYLAGYFSIR